MYKIFAKNIQFAVAMALLVISRTAFAALPWESPLEQLNSSLTGPVAKAVCTMVVCCSGVFLAVGDKLVYQRSCNTLISVAFTHRNIENIALVNYYAHSYVADNLVFLFCNEKK